VEFNIGLQAGHSPECYYYTAGDVAIGGLLMQEELAEQGAVGIVDKTQSLNVRLSWSSDAPVWVYPVQTVSQSESGLEHVYQSSVILPRWRIELQPGKTWDVDIRKEIIGS
jgi:alpha-amylase